GAFRSGQPEAAGSRPSLNVSLYRGGECVFYALQEYPAADAEWLSENEFRFGRTRIARSMSDGRCRVRLEVNLLSPGSDGRLVGTVEAEGALRRVDPTMETTGTSPHLWTPMAGPMNGRAQLSLGADARFFEVQGRAYHDRNGSPVSLDSLGIRHWVWGRVPFRTHEAIYYALWRKQGGPPLVLAMEIATDGTTTMREVTFHGQRRRLGRYGMPYWESYELRDRDGTWLFGRVEHSLDDGPFYLRQGARYVSRHGEQAHGPVELLRPARVDLPFQRPFVRMRVHHTENRNSAYLPFFAGRQRSLADRLFETGRRPLRLLLGGAKS
ncbi:MAG: hypothetical protein AAGF12_19735, partial [Myxococcota bacterium]